MISGLYDQHLHSNHSFDCDTPPEDNVLAAIDKGLAGLTFTEHFDTHPDEWPDCRYDDAAYSRTIADLRERYGDQVFVGKGIEVCYQPERMDFILDFLSRHEFDLVILSVHWADGRQIGAKENWLGLDAREGTRVYLRHVLSAVEHAGMLHDKNGQRCFDVLGHMDFVKRYTHRFFNEIWVDEFGDLLDEICHACMAANLIPEVNSSTLRQGLTEPMPGPDAVARYAQAGGTGMSLGSDAHLATAIGKDFDQARDVLRQNGISDLKVFRNRYAQESPLSVQS